MDNAEAQRRLLIRSFGYGVYAVEVVPAPGLNRAEISEFVKEKMGEFGLSPVQEVVLDPDEHGSAYAVIGYGMPPCKLELELMEEYLDRITAVIRSHPESRLSGRLRMLQEPAG